MLKLEQEDPSTDVPGLAQIYSFKARPALRLLAIRPAFVVFSSGNGLEVSHIQKELKHRP
jgi:hypothetical protein